VNCAPCVVFQHLDGHSAITGKITAGGAEICSRRYPTSFLRGPTTQPFQCLTAGALSAIGVELKPHATSALLGVDATETSDRMIDLNAFSGDNLGERLLNAGTQRDRLEIVAAFLTDRAQASRETDALVIESLQLIRDHVGFIRVHSLLAQTAAYVGTAVRKEVQPGDWYSSTSLLADHALSRGRPVNAGRASRKAVRSCIRPRVYRSVAFHQRRQRVHWPYTEATLAGG
jgi:Domain of unknown function (DUF6597)